MRSFAEACRSCNYTRISALERRVGIGLQHIFQNELCQDFYVEKIYCNVDFAVRSKKIIIQVDGPSHFFVGTRDYLPKHKLQDFILAKSGWQVLRLPYYELENTKDLNQYI